MKRTRSGVVGNRREWDRLSARQREVWGRVFRAIAIVRLKHVALSAAAHEAGTTVRTVLRYAGPAVRRQTNGRYRVASRDRLYRRVGVISEQGPVWADTWDSDEAREASRHAHAVKVYGRGKEDATVFDPFRGQKAGGLVFATDPALLASFAAAGELDDFLYYELQPRSWW